MIYIFGDSYGDPRQSPHDDVVANTDCWYSLLTKHEKVNNYCIGAIGPIDHFKLFWKNHNDICNDEHAKIVFLLSNPFRLNFDFLEEQSHAKEFGEFALIGNSLYRYFRNPVNHNVCAFRKESIKSFMYPLGRMEDFILWR